MNESRILTKHPLGRNGRNIGVAIYELLKREILAALQAGELTQTELMDQLNERLKGRFAGNVGWYGETVKLDLEARGTIETTSSKPQKYRLKHPID